MNREHRVQESQSTVRSDELYSLPVDNHEGFETGDYRNFSPTYLGRSDEWIRPTISVTDATPLAGDYSLRWTLDEQPHRWALVSNGFSLAPPYTVSALVRIDEMDEGGRAGLMALESYDRAVTLAASRTEASLTVGDSTQPPDHVTDAGMAPGRPYELEIKVDADGQTSARISDRERGDTVAHFSCSIDFEPTAVGLFVDAPEGVAGEVTFDDVSVEVDSYRFDSGKWVRAPKFVVLPRHPDVEQDQGNWVGAHSMIDDGDEMQMWYRIRNNESRGAGYGYATSEDGIHWTRYDDNPVFKPDSGVVSHEGISVLRIDGTYQAWYAVDDGETWNVALATSDDGIHWEEQGIVVEGYCKDPVVVHHDGRYYMYAIAPTNKSLAVYTSSDGVSWNRRNTFEMDSHRHPGAYYVDDPGEFHLYAFAEEPLGDGERFASETLAKSQPSAVSVATSTDGIEFGEFDVAWRDPQVGLDDRPAGGIDYGRFPTDARGHLQDDQQILMYYQARHNYNNNRPDWRMAGDGRVVLAGKFDGVFEDVPALVGPDGIRGYETFPARSTRIPDVRLEADTRCTITVRRGETAHDPLITGSVTASDDGNVRLQYDGAAADTDYVATVGEGRVISARSDGDGTVTVRLPVRSDDTTSFELRHDDR